MGKIAQGILGGFSGKVGTVVGGRWKNIDYIRAKPISVANPRTEGQVNQRNRFSITLEYLQPNLGFIQKGYKAYAVGKTEFNAAMSYVLNNAIVGTAPNFSVDYSLALGYSVERYYVSLIYGGGAYSTDLSYGNSYRFNLTKAKLAIGYKLGRGKKQKN